MKDIDHFVATAKIVVIDDDGSDLAMIERLLAGDGFVHVTGTTEARWGFHACAAIEPDLIILELSEPNLAGSEFLVALEKIVPEEEFHPVLIITDGSTEGVRKDAVRSGATHFLTRPVDASELLREVRSLLETRFVYRQLDWENLGPVVEPDAVADADDPSELAAVPRIRVLTSEPPKEVASAPEPEEEVASAPEPEAEVADERPSGDVQIEEEGPKPASADPVSFAYGRPHGRKKKERFGGVLGSSKRTSTGSS